ncbi:hypothetical protein [Aquibacillus albus]|uniref:Methyl-accepting chemotaxis protein n=1 Tax=Aquibacillus albus TaxID=1168171 RepID=A0ABS2N0J7_9BACI|nr:hypothetical protein [Aquibacillus albus]MBM7571670.1 methyl-accepting chemotaxis protein [Aquibacillus albus]
MSEERLDRIEAHMEQLIQMVAKSNKMVLENNELVLENNKVVHENNRMVHENTKMIKQLTEEAKRDREVNEARHKELLKEIRNSAYDIDYLRNEVSKHDMEIHKLRTSQ